MSSLELYIYEMYVKT